MIKFFSWWHAVDSRKSVCVVACRVVNKSKCDGECVRGESVMLTMSLASGREEKVSTETGGVKRKSENPSLFDYRVFTMSSVGMVAFGPF